MCVYSENTHVCVCVCVCGGRREERCASSLYGAGGRCASGSYLLSSDGEGVLGREVVVDGEDRAVERLWHEADVARPVSMGEGTRRVRLLRGEGRGVSWEDASRAC